MHWLKVLFKCKIRGVHKISVYHHYCVRCGKQTRINNTI